MAADPYSRMVSVLRIALPLLALAILSTLFLVSERVQPGENIPFAQNDVQDRVRDQRISSPVFNGVTSAGDNIFLTAEQMVTLEQGGNSATQVRARLDFLEGGSVSFISDYALIDFPQDSADLQGNVLIDSTAGYRIRSDQLLAKLSQIDVFSPGPVDGYGPAGTLMAGKMRITTTNTGKSVQFLFTEGVKLVYDPKETKD
ncbi:MAG: LPS export ABC transporter periplasmic protein LptC [Pseudomonadota bacterium]